MTWLLALKLILQLAAYFAKRAERRDIELAVLAQVENLHAKHVDAAADARDAIKPGDLPIDRNPNQRD